ncbi:MAG: YggT family protein [Oscillospiraceae bacterium]|nr:YggT family protein [Oscillospiraceae bacterium]
MGLYLVFKAIDVSLLLLGYAVLFNAILSWVPISRDGVVYRSVRAVTEPILSVIRGLTSNIGFLRNSRIDFTPVIAFFLIYILREAILTLAIGVIA